MPRIDTTKQLLNIAPIFAALARAAFFHHDKRNTSEPRRVGRFTEDNDAEHMVTPTAPIPLEDTFIGYRCSLCPGRTRA